MKGFFRIPNNYRCHHRNSLLRTPAHVCTGRCVVETRGCRGDINIAFAPVQAPVVINDRRQGCWVFVCESSGPFAAEQSRNDVSTK